MNNYQKSLIAEHRELVVRIRNLDHYVYGEGVKVDSKIEYANKCIQLSAMKKYAETLEARLLNAGVVFDGNNYLEVINDINSELHIGNIMNPEYGSDYDTDKERIVFMDTSENISSKEPTINQTENAE